MNVGITKEEFDKLPYRQNITTYPIFDIKYRDKDRDGVFIARNTHPNPERKDHSKFIWDRFGVTFVDETGNMIKNENISG